MIVQKAHLNAIGDHNVVYAVLAVYNPPKYHLRIGDEQCRLRKESDACGEILCDEILLPDCRNSLSAIGFQIGRLKLTEHMVDLLPCLLILIGAAESDAILMMFHESEHP